MSLEETTGRSIFEILIMDVSKVDSVKAAVATLVEPIDALILNAGGMGGKNPAKITTDGVTQMFATKWSDKKHLKCGSKTNGVFKKRCSFP